MAFAVTKCCRLFKVSAADSAQFSVWWGGSSLVISHIWAGMSLINFDANRCACSPDFPGRSHRASTVSIGALILLEFWRGKVYLIPRYQTHLFAVPLLTRSPAFPYTRSVSQAEWYGTLSDYPLRLLM